MPHHHSLCCWMTGLSCYVAFPKGCALLPREVAGTVAEELLKQQPNIAARIVQAEQRGAA